MIRRRFLACSTGLYRVTVGLEAPFLNCCPAAAWRSMFTVARGGSCQIIAPTAFTRHYRAVAVVLGKAGTHNAAGVGHARLAKTPASPKKVKAKSKATKKVKKVKKSKASTIKPVNVSPTPATPMRSLQGDVEVTTSSGSTSQLSSPASEAPSPPDGSAATVPQALCIGDAGVAGPSLTKATAETAQLKDSLGAKIEAAFAPGRPSDSLGLVAPLESPTLEPAVHGTRQNPLSGPEGSDSLLRKAAEAPTAAESAQVAQKSSLPMRQPPPPHTWMWPLDAGEFNAALPDGGHELRQKHEMRLNALQMTLRQSGRVSRLIGSETTVGAVGSTTRATGPSLSVPQCFLQLAATMELFSTLPVKEKLVWAQALFFPPPPTPQQLLEVHRVSGAQATIEAGGGWVCHHCLAPNSSHMKALCGQCGALRHDHAATVDPVRLDPSSRLCPECFEATPVDAGDACAHCGSTKVNASTISATDAAAQASGGRRTASESETGVPAALGRDDGTVTNDSRESLRSEMEKASIGSVIVMRNRTSRWRCDRCLELNSLQGLHCRCCARERFDITVSCRVCQAENRLDNASMFGNDAAARVSSSRVITYGHCFPQLGVNRRCHQCQSLLHGSQMLSAARSVWLCACGVLNGANTHSPSCTATARDITATSSNSSGSSGGAPPAVAAEQQEVSVIRSVKNRASCSRCRCPRSFPHEELLEKVAAKWDFSTCTTWYCESCHGINKASRNIVVIDRAGQRSASGGAPRALTTVYGVSECLHCAMPWHYQLLNNGKNWRCSCHYINDASDSHCLSCGLPGVEGIKASPLSMWTRGDWYCVHCRNHNYRERVKCACGAIRPRVVM